MSKRASKKEMELRVDDAAELVLHGQAYSLITSHVAKNIAFLEGKLEELLLTATFY